MRHLVVSIAALTACTLSAQTPSKKATTPQTTTTKQQAGTVERVWEKEPEGFLGIKFNEPLMVQKCPFKTAGQDTYYLDYEALKSLEGVCLDTTDTLYRYQKPENGTYKLQNLPSLGIYYRASVIAKNNVVSKITIDLKQPNFSVLLGAFKDRYGMPSSLETSTVKTNAGAEFNAAYVTWKGKKLSIQMYERMGRIDESYVVISDNAIIEEEIAAQRAKRGAEAQKF